MTGTKRINKSGVDALKPQTTRFVSWDTEIPGFGVRVYPTGQKVYLLKYRVGGGRSARIRWALIGRHGSVTPDQARDIARRWAALLRDGSGPSLLRHGRAAVGDGDGAKGGTDGGLILTRPAQSQQSRNEH